MNIDDETLMALADGEIDDDKARRLHALISVDPELSARFTLFTQSSQWVKKAALADAGAAVAPEFIDHIRELAATTAPEAENVVPMSHTGTRWQPMAMAASLALVVGLSVGLVLARNSPDTPETGIPVVTADLQDQLGTLPSGTQSVLPDGRQVSMVSSFTDGAGAFCREYETAALNGTSYVNVACRDGSDWTLRLSVATAAVATGYAPASSLETLDAFYTATSASQPLSAEAERDFLE